MYPDDRKYSREHEWIRVDGDLGIVGITQFAQEQLGDVVFLELPKVGAAFGAMERFGTIESVKAVSDLFCPVSGEVVEVNEALVDSPELVNKDPHGAAWLMKVRLKDPGELGALLSASEYQEHVQKEGES